MHALSSDRADFVTFLSSFDSAVRNGDGLVSRLDQPTTLWGFQRKEMEHYRHHLERAHAEISQVGRVDAVERGADGALRVRASCGPRYKFDPRQRYELQLLLPA